MYDDFYWMFFFKFFLGVDNAYACDPRIKKFKDEEKEKKLAEKKAKEEAARAVAEEKERVSKLDEDNLLLYIIYLPKLLFWAKIKSLLKFVGRGFEVHFWQIRFKSI